MSIEKLEKIDKEYKTSKKGFKCLGHCYRPGTVIIHPITLMKLTNTDHAFCAVPEWENVDPYTGKSALRYTDMCTNPVRPGEINSKELAMNIVSPDIDFTAEHFLKIYYSIFSMEAAVEWVEEHSDSPYYTKKRVIDSAWKAYGFSNYTLDDRLVVFYIDLIRERELDSIFRAVYRKISKVEGEFKIKKNFDSAEKDVAGKKKFIRDKMITYDNFTRFITQYMEKFAPKSRLVRSHTDNIVSMFHDFLVRKVDVSI